jgi:hypothetical protein
MVYPYRLRSPLEPTLPCVNEDFIGNNVFAEKDFFPMTVALYLCIVSCITLEGNNFLG